MFLFCFLFSGAYDNRYFVEDQQDKECFCACLYTCYSFVMPDVALELAWRYQMSDFVMPYMIQYMRGLHDTVKVLEERAKPREDGPDEASHVVDSMMSMGDNSMLMLGNGPAMPGAGAGYGMPPPPGGMDMGMGGMSGMNGALTIMARALLLSASLAWFLVGIPPLRILPSSFTPPPLTYWLDLLILVCLV